MAAVEGKHAQKKTSSAPSKSAAFPNLDDASARSQGFRPAASFDMNARGAYRGPQQGGQRMAHSGNARFGNTGNPGFAQASAAPHFDQGKKRNPKVIAAAVVVAVLVVIYLVGVVVFSTHFYPNTTMGKFDFSMKTFDEAIAELDSAEESYALAISGQGFTSSISSEEGGVQIDSSKVVSSASGDMVPALWFVKIFGAHDKTDCLASTANSNSLREIITAEIDEFNAEQTVSKDASIAYDSASRTYQVIPEVNGGQLDAEAVVQKAITAALSMQESLALGDDVVIKPQVLSSDSRLTEGAAAANKLVACDVTLVAQLSSSTKEITEVNADTISQWITFDESYAPVFDEDAMNEWAESLGSSLNTVGASRTYTRGDGKQVSVSGGDYGWAVDSSTLVSSVKDAISNGTQGEVCVECTQTGNGYTSAGMDWGAYCDVDLSEQHARYYDASGNLLWESGIVSGAPTDGNSTPTGVYYLKMHQSPSMLRGPKDDSGNYAWESEVQYWMPFVGNLVGLHDADWQPSSAFSNPTAYSSGYGSHGCVNLPTDKAGEIYNIIQNGDPVIVHW